jgi:alanyl aminopeptidase
LRRGPRCGSRRGATPSGGATIAGAFDWITYLKGAALLGMFEKWLGAEIVATAMRAYLSAHRHGTARSEDLLAALSQASGRDVTSVARGFLDQPGLPVVEVAPACEAGRPTVTLRQRPLLHLGSRGAPDRSWQVPVCLRYEAGSAAPAEHCVVLLQGEQRIDLPAPRCPRWLMPNADAAGYYRWALPPDAMRELVQRGLPHLTVRERLAAADQLVVSVWTGHVPIEDALALVPAFAGDPEPAVARAVFPLLWLVHEALTGTASVPRLQSFVRGLGPPLSLARLAPAPPDGALSAAEVARLELRAWVGEDEPLRRALADRARRWLAAARDALAPELVQLGLSVAASDGDAGAFDVLVAALWASRDAMQRERILIALGSFSDPALANRARALELDDRLIVGEMGTVIETQLAGVETRDAAWAWTKANWVRLERRLGPDLAAFWILHTSTFCSAAAARDVTDFFEPRRARLPGSPRLLANAVESIEQCAARVEATREGARRFFQR